MTPVAGAAMPIRVYEPLAPPCRLCGAGFDLVQRTGEPPLQECPRCGQPVRLRAAAAANLPRVTRRPSTGEIKSAGFSVYRRNSGGGFERQ